MLAAVGSALDLLEAVERCQPDAVLTDIRMPPGHQMDGIEAARKIRAAKAAIGVVVLFQYADPSYAAELLKDGAGGLAYLLKDRVDDRDELLRALREVVAGRSVIDGTVVEALVGARRRASTSPISRLTPRELDMLQAMAEGRTNGAIAESLNLSGSAIEKYISGIFSKLDLAPEAQIHRRVSAVVAYLRSTADSF